MFPARPNLPLDFSLAGVRARSCERDLIDTHSLRLVHMTRCWREGTGLSQPLPIVISPFVVTLIRTKKRQPVNGPRTGFRKFQREYFGNESIRWFVIEWLLFALLAAVSAGRFSARSRRYACCRPCPSRNGTDGRQNVTREALTPDQKGRYRMQVEDDCDGKSISAGN